MVAGKFVSEPISDASIEAGLIGAIRYAVYSNSGDTRGGPFLTSDIDLAAVTVGDLVIHEAWASYTVPDGNDVNDLTIVAQASVDPSLLLIAVYPVEKIARDEVRAVFASFEPGIGCTNQEAHEVEVTDWTWSRDGVGYLWIQGEVANNSSGTIQLVELQFKLLDAADGLVGVASGYTNSTSIPAGRTSIFQIVVREPRGLETVQLTSITWQ